MRMVPLIHRMDRIFYKKYSPGVSEKNFLKHENS